MSGFYDVDVLDQVAINLFYGWGYNFYKLENQLRADDLMIRAKVSWLLGIVRGDLETLQSDYRQKHLPAPTRAKPSPDPASVESAQSLETLCNAIGSIEALIRSAPVPENDRMTQRYRQEAVTLLQLQEVDKMLVGTAQVMRTTLVGKDDDWLLANQEFIKEGIAMLRRTMQDRQSLLQ